MKMIRYCYECGRVGPVGPTHINCCPDGIHAVEVPVQVAHQARAGFLASLAGQAAAPEGWISVDERMPEPGTECIVWCRECVPGFGPFAKLDTWDEQREAPVSFSSATIPVGPGWDDSDYEDITHWMPLPTPPGAAPARAPAAEPVTLEEIPDVELPGMWERADFIGGADDAASQPQGAAVARMLTEAEIDDLVRDGLMTDASARALIKRVAYKVLEVNGIALRTATAPTTQEPK